MRIGRKLSKSGLFRETPGDRNIRQCFVVVRWAAKQACERSDEEACRGRCSTCLARLLVRKIYEPVKRLNIARGIMKRRETIEGRKQAKAVA